MLDLRNPKLSVGPEVGQFEKWRALLQRPYEGLQRIGREEGPRFCQPDDPLSWHPRANRHERGGKDHASANPRYPARADLGNRSDRRGRRRQGTEEAEGEDCDGPPGSQACPLEYPSPDRRLLPAVEGSRLLGGKKERGGGDREGGT